MEEDEVTRDPEFDENDRGMGGTNEFVPDHVLDGGRDFRVEGNDASGFIGVDPEYQTYGNEYDKPILTDVERFNLTDQLDHLEGNADDEFDSDGNPREASAEPEPEPAPESEVADVNESPSSPAEPTVQTVPPLMVNPSAPK